MSNTPSKLSVIFAGEEIPAILTDGTPLQVRVRAMPARHLLKVLPLAEKEAELLDYVCLIPMPDDAGEGVVASDFSGWQRLPTELVNSLSDESHEQLYEAAKRLNFMRAVKMAQRLIAARKITGEIELAIEEVFLPQLERMARSLGLSPKASASPAAPTTKS